MLNIIKSVYIILKLLYHGHLSISYNKYKKGGKLNIFTSEDLHISSQHLLMTYDKAYFNSETRYLNRDSESDLPLEEDLNNTLKNKNVQCH